MDFLKVVLDEETMASLKRHDSIEDTHGHYEKMKYGESEVHQLGNIVKELVIHKEEWWFGLYLGP